MNAARPLLRAAEAEPVPESLESEAALLGAILIEGTILDGLQPMPTPDDFFQPAHGRIFAKICEERAAGKNVTPSGLKRFFESDPDLQVLGGPTYLARLASNTECLLAAREAAEDIVDAALRRRLAEYYRERLAASLDRSRPLVDVPPPEDLRPSGVVASPFKWKDPATIPQRPHVYGRSLLLATVACIVAPGGAGKTTFVSGFAVSMTSGRSILGKDLPRGRQRVWIWNLEDDMDELHRSIQAAALHHGIRAAELDGWLFVNSGLEGATLCTARDDRDGFHLDTGVFNAVAAEIKRRGVGVLIIDPFVSSHQADESNNGKVDAIAKAWARVAKATNCLIVLVHHVSKAGAGDVTANSSRGAVSLINAARSVLVLNRMDEAEADRLGITPAERRRYIRIGDDKSNRAPAEEADWFRIASVDLGNGDNVGALEPWKLPDPFDDVTLDDLRAVQARISDGEWREHYQAKAWAGRLIGEVLGFDVDQKPGRAKATALLTQWIKSGALRIEERPDRNREMRKFVIMGGPA